MNHPEAVFVQLSTACNARCVNCPHPFTYGSKGHHRRGVMVDEVWNKLVDDMRAMEYRGQVGLYLHHEPLLVGSLFDRIRDVNRVKAFAVLSTNGSLLDDDTRARLVEACPAVVHININSGEEKQYEEMTGLDFASVVERTTRFIEEARGRICVEINCPVLPGVEVAKLARLFPGTKVNADFWANSRGGMLPAISAYGRESRFKVSAHCVQPDQNFNVLFDGSVIVCCNDWSHESKGDFPNIMESSIMEIYHSPAMERIRKEFAGREYGRFRMCRHCARELGFVDEPESSVMAGEFPVVGMGDARAMKKDINHPEQNPSQEGRGGSAFSSPGYPVHDGAMAVVEGVEEKERALSEQPTYSGRPWRILLTNIQLFSFTGSEVFTYAAADHLKRLGHHVTAYSPFIGGELRDRFETIGVPLTDSLDKIGEGRFDVVHCHHNLCALEVRRCLPSTPMVFVSHGVLPFLERPPFVDLSISKYLAVSEEVQNGLLAAGIPGDTIEIFRNVVDSGAFQPFAKIHDRPERILVFNYRLDAYHLQIIAAACEALGIPVDFAGGTYGQVSQARLPALINGADIVFTAGRGAMETMLCGRVPIIVNASGTDGLVSPDNFDGIMSCNFSGRSRRLNLTADMLVEEIGRYSASYGEALRQLAMSHFDAATRVRKLVDIYEEAISLPFRPVDARAASMLDAFHESMSETRRIALYFGDLRRDRDRGSPPAKAEVEERDCAVPDVDAFNAMEWNGGTFTTPDDIYRWVQENLVSQGRTDDAVSALVKLVAAHPDHALAYNDLGVLYDGRGLTAKARLCYERAVAIGGGSPTILRNAADFYYVRLKMPGDAVPLYRRVLAFCPDDAEVPLILGGIHVERGEFREAFDSFSRVLELDPCNDFARTCVEGLRERLSAPEERPAVDDLYSEALVCLRNGEYDRAETLLRKFLAASPSSAPACNDLGFLAYRRGDKEEARLYYEKALAADEKNTTALKNLADLYLVEEDRTVEAIELYQRALRENGHDGEALTALGSISAKCERYVEALLYFDRALLLDPENGDLQAIVGSLRERAEGEGRRESPRRPLPAVSIIAAVEGPGEDEQRRIQAILSNADYPDRELILVCREPVDREDYAALSDQAGGLKVVCRDGGMTMAGAAALAARESRGAYVAFLTGNLSPSRGWLLQFMRSILSCDNAAGVTGKTVRSPDRIVEAGYSVLTDKGLEGWGCGEAADGPPFNYSREIPGGSCRSILVPADAVRDTGGLDGRFEDLGAAMFNLAHSMRAGGRRLYYEPSSVFALVDPPKASLFQEDGTLRPEILARLRPSIVAPFNGNGGSAKPRVLVLGVYLAGKPNNAGDIISVLNDSSHCDVTQRWVALGGPPANPRLGAATIRVLMGKRPKYAIMNDLIAAEDLSRYDYLLMTDDDVVMPLGFLDTFIAMQKRLGYVLAQPARTTNSYIDHPIVTQQRGVLARETLFVEIGPVISFHERIFGIVFPFDLTSPMGWGYENVWSRELSGRGLAMGIIDNTPVDHSMRKPVEHYSWDEADGQRSLLFRKHRHRSYDECFRVLKVVGEEDIRK